jgi:hypothetical protein
VRVHALAPARGDTWHERMTNVLGYLRYAKHGGDWGSTVTELLARDHAQEGARKGEAIARSLGQAVVRKG